jgi:hypothetical protein
MWSPHRSIELPLIQRWLEELEPTDRDDATTAPRWRLGLAAIVPLDAGQQTNGTATRVPVARGLLLAW